MSQYEVQCSNCGTRWFLETAGEGSGGSSGICPVCHLHAEEGQTPLVPVASISDLEGQLDTLVRNALASGLAHEAVLHALRDELTFTAELGQAGSRFTVQVIDLGPREGDGMQRPLHDRRNIASSRGNA